MRPVAEGAARLRLHSSRCDEGRMPRFEYTGKSQVEVAVLEDNVEESFFVASVARYVFDRLIWDVCIRTQSSDASKT